MVLILQPKEQQVEALPSCCPSLALDNTVLQGWAASNALVSGPTWDGYCASSAAPHSWSLRMYLVLAQDLCSPVPPPGLGGSLLMLRAFLAGNGCTWTRTQGCLSGSLGTSGETKVGGVHRRSHCGCSQTWAFEEPGHEQGLTCRAGLLLEPLPFWSPW